ncbi:MAG: Crp/Fnr family transcriptional regulator [Chitinophagales bacterium]|nr:Crp/Fnr family transcriptional regulator [Chitinophagales bacterium]
MQNKAQIALQKFMAQFGELTAEEQLQIADNLIVEAYPKGKLLVKAGDVCRYCYFVLEGCLRQYKLADDTEVTIQFYTEREAAVDFNSYVNQVKSESYLVCMEDTIVIEGNLEQETDMYERFPKLQQITRAMMEQDFGKMQEQFSRFIASNAEERYVYLLNNRPDLLQRVPLQYLASYIGVTPESLSRIRKRIQSR